MIDFSKTYPQMLPMQCRETPQSLNLSENNYITCAADSTLPSLVSKVAYDFSAQHKSMKSICKRVTKSGHKVCICQKRPFSKSTGSISSVPGQMGGSAPV